ncbi:hypothetical protein Pyn_09003 [Prunus yedoensis var. nudiflora]|uniref:Glycerol-3-phosphate transporter 5 n=1 Tax=Prunus yedoensis var. nudiflora TaxID=2094558 RepID=A0A314USG7_PRUYE|nr:hypothetical protein Pyn_09003 [Prunus yedoensis var. nudiflora]
MAVQVLCGLVSQLGWPCVVAVVGNWFEKEKRGMIMGIWGSHTSVGNIIGSVVASGVKEFGWGWENLEGKVESEEAGLLGTENVDVDTSADTLAAIGFLEAWRLPGVAPFAFCLFFSKLVSYTLVLVALLHKAHRTAGNLSAVFDIGGVFVGILAGLISDMIEARAVMSVTFLLLSVPALVFYRVYGSLSMVANILLMFLSGLLVNSPYSLITTAIAADLGTQTVIRGNSRALATVTAIIDGWGGSWATFSGYADQKTPRRSTILIIKGKGIGHH